MDEHHCWEIVEAARVDAGPGWERLDQRLTAALVRRLVTLPAGQVARFGDYFRALQRRVNREDLFMAAFLIHHGCGDDSLGDFGAGLVGLGRDWYLRALADPDCLADHPAVRGVAAGEVDISVLLTEGFRRAPERALREVTGEEFDGFYYAAAPVRLDDPAAAPPVRNLERLAGMFPQQQAYLRELYPYLAA